MHWTPRRAQFRALLAGDACVNPGSVFDPMSTRIAEDLGYQVGILAGSVASMAALGAPDLIVLTLTELAEQCLRIDRAGSLPLIVDADHGFGNALTSGALWRSWRRPASRHSRSRIPTCRSPSARAARRGLSASRKASAR